MVSVWSPMPRYCVNSCWGSLMYRKDKAQDEKNLGGEALSCDCSVLWRDEQHASQR